MEDKVKSESERAKELKAFDETKLGVKGLVDSGITKIPPIFYHPLDNYNKASDLGYTNYTIPVIDLSGVHEDRKGVVERVREASEKWGFFHVVNHGIPISTMKEIIDGVLRFHEQDNEVKKGFYTRDQRPFMYHGDVNLFRSPLINWQDSIFWDMAPISPKPEDLPAVCRDIIVEYTNEIMKLGTLLFELLSEALGMNSTYLKDIDCTEGLYGFGHYYPACPEPELTMGAKKHTDAVFLTVLLQDHIGGLQILHQDMWIDVPPQPGALIVNIGDFLQLISNDKFKSTVHRVVANHVGPRVSVAYFFSTAYHPSSRLYGPIKELLSEDNPPKYRDVSVLDVLSHFRQMQKDGITTSPVMHFRI